MGESEVAQMAIGKKAAPAKEAEKRKPDFVVRAKVKEDVWVTIGAAWSAQLKGGVTGTHSRSTPSRPSGTATRSSCLHSKRRSDAFGSCTRIRVQLSVFRQTDRGGALVQRWMLTTPAGAD
jgi:hypothetical protein